MSVLTKAEIFEEGALQTEVVTLKKGDVIVSQIGATDIAKLWSNPENQIKDENGKDVINTARFVPAVLVYSVVDEAGNRMFTEDDIDRLSKLNQEVFSKLSEVARRLNGMTGEEVKNSDDSQQDLPLSGSVSN